MEYTNTTEQERVVTELAEMTALIFVREGRISPVQAIQLDPRLKFIVEAAIKNPSGTYS